MHTTFVRPFKPAELTAGAVEGFDLLSLAHQLMTEKAFTEHGRNALTLARQDEFTMVLTVAKEGKEVPEHSAPGPAAIVMIFGSVAFGTPDDTHRVELGTGSSVAFAPDVMHHIKAHTDSAFLIILGARQES